MSLGHELSASWDVQRPGGEGRLFPGRGHASPGPEPLTPSERRGSLGWQRGQQEQPQASLFSMAFYSYVILLLTHIGIGAMAHGGGGQRRVRILSKGTQGEPGQWPSPLSAQAAGLAKGALLCCSPPHWPLPHQV